jgi:hypothetical protein
LQVIIHLPNYVFLPEDLPLKAGLWDSNTKTWTTDNIEGEVKLGKEGRSLEFKTAKLAPLAFVVDRCIDFPYKGWYIRCTELDKALLDLVTKRERFVFEITPGEVKLIERNEASLAHIVNKPFAPGMLLYELFKCGINLIPTDEDEELTDYKCKEKDVEERAVFEIATSVNGFAFRSSVWNKSLSPGTNSNNK